MKNVLLILAIAIGAYTAAVQYYSRNSAAPAGRDVWRDSVESFSQNPAAPAVETSGSDSVLASAFANRLSALQVEGQGIVFRILPDDNDGSRHQRFILKLRSGQTLLIAHNIDLAPRVSSLNEGDGVSFKGQYEWNSQGGVIHWTHRDSGRRHPAGWLKHNGETSE